MRSVAWFSHDQYKKDGFFLICEPGGNIDFTMGKVFTKRGDPVVLLVIAVVFIVAIFISMEGIEYVTESDWIIGSLTGGLLGGLFTTLIMAAAVMANRGASSDNSFRVTTKNQQAWRLCLTVAKLGRSSSWADGTVDTGRQAPSILWSAVGRSIALDQQGADAAQALEPSSLEDFESSSENLTKEKLSKIDQERQSLNVVEACLSQVLKTAISIDRQRVRIAGDKRSAGQRRRKARKWRDRLPGYNKTAAAQLSDTEAGRSAELAAETKSIADLLAGCDRILRESGRATGRPATTAATSRNRRRRDAAGRVKLIYALVVMANVSLLVGVFIYTRISPDIVTDESLPPTDAVPVSALPPRPPDAASDRILPPVVSTTTGKHVFTRMTPDGWPVTFDPCYPIHYVVNPSGMPDGGLELIRDAIQEISAATGLAFTEDGVTQEPSRAGRELALKQPQLYGDRWAPVLITWANEAESTLLGGDVTGGARHQAIQTDGLESARYVTGHILFDREKFTDLLARDGYGYADARAIVLHELGHLVGLGHVADRGELMYWKSGRTRLGPGDRQGLATAGAGPCWTDP